MFKEFSLSFIEKLERDAKIIALFTLSENTG
jgi:hypothetical protein